MTILWDDVIGIRPFEDPISDDEAARVYRWCCDESLLRWSGGVPSDLSLAEFAERLRNDQRDFLDQRRVFFIFTRDQRIIGRIGVFAIDWARRDGELGIVIGEPTEWGKGYGTRAVALLLHHLFETTPLERVYLFTYPENIRAQRCFASAGFRTLGATQRFLPELGARAGIEMEITRREFNERSFGERKNPGATEKSNV
ncbi:MAG: GNAT family N-acetyltransferase [Chloroflexi bacterium]|nr:GNAT family N-acetyltransferase [Chloroflexota bacterium]